MKSNLRNHKIRHLRISPPICVSEGSLIRDAIRQMQTQRVGCVLVCQNDRLVGIMTEVDVVRKAELGEAAWNEPIQQWMTRAPVSIAANASIWDAAKAMKDGGFRHLPVIDGEGNPMGFISIRNIVTYLADQFPDTVYTLPPDPDKIPGTPEGA
ncbi:CBS domain-containing protein [Candidatus Nitronereus thalassa]|uniref:CBS domain-containing protein n=1 Tax=Candidatus Nitronereus thalassa TaxID=3020898 RepID=A0ABU3K319_9BACT|nr:CBS domain-containing protein [Candidatus Nitronereus thalassa]MDT7040764.1 CBS domain-containing protein [Candidatus Nitronereus thalassa]